MEIGKHAIKKIDSLMANSVIIYGSHKTIADGMKELENSLKTNYSIYQATKPNMTDKDIIEKTIQQITDERQVMVILSPDDKTHKKTHNFLENYTNEIDIYAEELPDNLYQKTKIYKEHNSQNAIILLKEADIQFILNRYQTTTPIYESSNLLNPIEHLSISDQYALVASLDQATQQHINNGRNL